MNTGTVEIDLGLVEELTKREVAALDEKHAESLRYREVAKAHLPGGVSSSWQSWPPHPIYVDRGAGWIGDAHGTQGPDVALISSLMAPGSTPLVHNRKNFELAAAGWEREILPARVARYEPGWLDELCLSGEIAWGRLRRHESTRHAGRRLSGSVPITLLRRPNLTWLLEPRDLADETGLSGPARDVLARLRAAGASFVDDIAARVEGKSSLGRLGLLTHATAGFVDPGFSGHVTLELANVATLPIKLYPGMKIGQFCFFRLSSPSEHPYGSEKYGSRYQGQRGPTPSRSFQNFHRTPI